MLYARTACSWQRPNTRSVVPVHSAEADHTRVRRPSEHPCYATSIACRQGASHPPTFRQGLPTPERCARIANILRRGSHYDEGSDWLAVRAPSLGRWMPESESGTDRWLMSDSPSLKATWRRPPPLITADLGARGLCACRRHDILARGRCGGRRGWRHTARRGRWPGCRAEC